MGVINKRKREYFLVKNPICPISCLSKNPQKHLSFPVRSNNCRHWVTYGKCMLLASLHYIPAYSTVEPLWPYLFIWPNTAIINWNWGCTFLWSPLFFYPTICSRSSLICKSEVVQWEQASLPPLQICTWAGGKKVICIQVATCIRILSPGMVVI